MKKFILLIIMIIMGLFLLGCGTDVERSEFWKHSSHYASWEHTFYSWSGYKNPTQETLKQSNDQGWWGIPTPE